MSTTPIDWPPLPRDGFIRGRAATAYDIDDGSAVFCQKIDDGAVSEPFPIDIPQYVLWREEDGTVSPAVLVQAERHVTDPEGEPLLGLRCLDGREVVATESEVDLLGTVPSVSSAPPRGSSRA